LVCVSVGAACGQQNWKATAIWHAGHSQGEAPCSIHACEMQPLTASNKVVISLLLGVPLPVEAMGPEMPSPIHVATLQTLFELEELNFTSLCRNPPSKMPPAVSSFLT